MGVTPPEHPARISRATRARLGYLVGVVLAAAGLGWQIGYGWGLVVLGAGVAAAYVWLYPVDEPGDGPDQHDDDDTEEPW